MTSRVRLLAAQAGLLGLSVVFLVVPASAIFLDRYGAAELPFVYLAVAVLGVVLSRVLRALQARLSLVAVATWCIGAFVAIVAASWVLLRFAHQDWVSALLVGLFPLAIPVGFVLVGTQAGRLLDVRTMKQSFARIVAGFSLGFVVGGLATAALIGPLGGPVDLLLVGVVAGAAYFGTAVATGRRFPDELGQRPEPERRAPGPEVAPAPRPPRQGLFVMIFGYQLLAAAVTQLLDFVVWERAAYHFPDPSDLARFQGLFNTVINVVALAFVFVVAGRLLVRHGERGGLLANPLGLVVLLLGGTLVGVIGGEGAVSFFVLVCAAQVAHIALIDGMTRAAINTAYQALEPPTRLHAQTVVEAAGVPLAVGFVGAMLLGFRFADLGVRVVVAVTLLLVVGWLVVALLAHRRYRDGVLALVTARPWEPLDLLDSDDEVVKGLLASADPRDVMVGLSAVNGRRRLPAEEVAGLMTSADPYVRMAAVCELVEAGGDSAPEAERLWVAALRDPEPRVREASLSGCAAAPDPFFAPYLLDAITESPPSAGLADALERHAADVAPGAVDRLTREPSGVVRERLIWALGVMRDSLPAAPTGLPEVRAEVAASAARVALARAAATTLGGDPAVATLRRALAEDVERSGRTLADHLAMHYGRRRVDRIVAALGEPGAHQRALATELLEVLAGRHTGERIVTLLDPHPDGNPGLVAGLEGYAATDRSAAEWVTELAADPDGYWADPWLKACAIHVVPTVLGASGPEVVGPSVDDPDPVVAETARWALATASPR
jgi:HEAT repeat protein